MKPNHLAHRINKQRVREKLFALPMSEFMQSVTHTDNAMLRQRLFLEQEGRCNRCNNYEWLGREIPLELEHKNGDHHDNSPQNVEMLCPNCHALTETWRGRNKKPTVNKVSDEELTKALLSEASIRQALIKVGLAGKGGNYKRAYELLSRVANSTG